MSNVAIQASIISILLSVSCSSQNLIPDSSFACTDSTGTNKYWFGVTDHSEVFIAPSDTCVKLYGMIHRYGSRADSSRHDFFWFNPFYWEPGTRVQKPHVIGCELLEVLERDSLYEVSMWVLPSPLLEIEAVQVYFSDKKLLKVDKIKNSPRVDLIRPSGQKLINAVVAIRKKTKNETGTFYGKWIVDFENKWLRISGTYKASGNEKFLYVGNVNKFTYQVYTGKVKRKKLIPDKENDPENAIFQQMLMNWLIDDISVKVCER